MAVGKEDYSHGNPLGRQQKHLKKEEGYLDRRKKRSLSALG